MAHIVTLGVTLGRRGQLLGRVAHFALPTPFIAKAPFRRKNLTVLKQHTHTHKKAPDKFSVAVPIHTWLTAGVGSCPSPPWHLGVMGWLTDASLHFSSSALTL